MRAAAECVQLLPAARPGMQRKRGRGNQFKDADAVAAGRKRVRVARAQKRLDAKRLARKRPLNERERCAASAKPAGVQPGQRVPGGRKGKQPVSPTDLVDESAEDVTSESDSEDVWGGSDSE